eukprot:14616-Heterococcus_DN1.PRE.18
MLEVLSTGSTKGLLASAKNAPLEELRSAMSALSILSLTTLVPAKTEVYKHTLNLSELNKASGEELIMNL